MYWKTIRIAMLIVIGIAITCLAAGCDGEEIGNVSKDVADITRNMTPHTPAPISSILYLISAIASAVSGVAFGVVKYNEARKMRKAIEATSKVIENAEFHEDPELREAARKTTAFIGQIKALNNPGISKDLNYFDAVRKGYR